MEVSFNEILKSISKRAGDTPCQLKLCSTIKYELCADKGIGCRAWRHYIKKGKVAVDKIGKFKDSVCARCRRNKEGCIKRCHRMKA